MPLSRVLGTAEQFVCNGEDVTIFTAGRNGWVDGVKYKAVMLTAEGAGFSDVKVWGGGTLAAAGITDGAPSTPVNRAGVITLTFGDGRSELVWSGTQDDWCAGTYSVADGRLNLVASARAAVSDVELSPQPDFT